MTKRWETSNFGVASEPCALPIEFRKGLKFQVTKDCYDGMSIPGAKLSAVSDKSMVTEDVGDFNK